MTRRFTMICMQNDHIHNHIQTILYSNILFFLSVQKFSRKLLYNSVALWLHTGAMVQIPAEEKIFHLLIRQAILWLPFTFEFIHEYAN